MTDLLISIILVGTATAYILETLDLILYLFVEKSFLTKILSLPLCLGGIWIMQKEFSLSMMVSVPASTFVSVLLIKYLNKPTTVQYQRLPRL